jgi:hypothetical protein
MSRLEVTSTCAVTDELPAVRESARTVCTVALNAQFAKILPSPITVTNSILRLNVFYSPSYSNPLLGFENACDSIQSRFWTLL